MAERVVAGSKGRPSSRPISVVPGGLGTPIPAPPRNLGGTGTEAWTRYWTVGRGWLSNEAHYDLLLQVCETLDRRAALTAVTRRRGFRLIVRGSMGQERLSPVIEAIDRADAKIADLLLKLRFQPDEQRQRTLPAKNGLDGLRERRRIAS